MSSLLLKQPRILKSLGALWRSAGSLLCLQREVYPHYVPGLSGIASLPEVAGDRVESCILSVLLVSPVKPS